MVEPIQFIVVIVLGLISGYCFIKVAYSLRVQNYEKGIFPLVGLLFSSLTSLLILSILLSANNKLRVDVDKKCPEYEKIENVYIIKK
jgi:hypothetical protein